MDERAVFDSVLSTASFTVVIVGQFSVHDALSHIYFNPDSMLLTYLCLCDVICENLDG